MAQRKSQVEMARKLVGQPVDGLSLADRWRFSGVWVALEIYTPQRLPLRMIEAVGGSAAECIQHIVSRGLEADRFEFIPLPQPYQA